MNEEQPDFEKELEAADNLVKSTEQAYHDTINHKPTKEELNEISQEYYGEDHKPMIQLWERFFHRLVQVITVIIYGYILIGVIRNLQTYQRTRDGDLLIAAFISIMALIFVFLIVLRQLKRNRRFKDYLADIDITKRDIDRINREGYEDD